MVVGWGQDCDDGYVWIDDIPDSCESDGNCFYQSDLDVLQIFIDNSSETIDMDMDVDSSGVIEPLELGEQEWVDGRITVLDCYWYSPISSFNECRISGEIPPEIGNLINLEELLLYFNELSGEIPTEIGNLTNLTVLGLSYNELTGEIPEEICNQGDSSPNLVNNQLCPPYPECLSVQDIVPQEISECEDEFTCDEGYIELWGWCYNIETTTYLNLSSSGLTGELPSEISYLINLDYLNLSDNELTGQIPPELGNLINLEDLVLGSSVPDDELSNQLSGEIPSEIGNLTNLTSLNLRNNLITGEIPPEIGNLTNLTSLSLYSNQLTGEIPPEIGNLTNLNYLILDKNQLSGEIPPEIGNLTNLEKLSLYINQLSGEIPPEIGNLSNLNWLLLSENQLTGQIPSELGNLMNLQKLYLFGNQLTGIIPEEIGNLTNLDYLYLFENQLTGEIPSSIGNLTTLLYLNLNDNQLSGEIPESICDLNLNFTDYHFYIQNNQLCPPYPECLGPQDIGYQYLEDCQYIIECESEYLETNGFCYYQSDLDVLQIFIDNSSETINMDMDDNGNGIIEPLELGEQVWYDGRIQQLNSLWYNIYPGLYYNYGLSNLSGEIPSEIENLTNLTNLDLSHNQLTGEIPSEIYNLTNLTNLDLSHNQLTGEILPEIGNLINLSGNPDEPGLVLSHNQLTGEIPEEIWNLTNLQFLYLNDNQLTGEIPENICNFPINFNYGNGIENNQLCPPYPECLSEDEIGYQDTTNCSSMSISYLSLPTQYTLHQPFPNPFNPTTSISFSIPEQSQTSLKIYDIKGNLISTLLNQTLNVGHHQIEWNGENLSSGTYFIRINSGEFSDVKKVVLVK